MHLKYEHLTTTLASFAPKKNVVIGFDGYIDRILRVRRSRDTFFSTLSQFGQYIEGKANKSCSLELKQITEKIGGNMPIFSQALAKLGVPVNCIGAMGYPEVLPLFHTMDSNCRLLSVSDPGICQALEFDDGKLMLANNDQIEQLDYPLLLQRAGKENLFSLFDRSDMMVLLNWSELKGSLSIWKGLEQDIFPYLSPKKRLALIDLSDCSCRSAEEIREACSLMRHFSHRFDLTVSMNRNEAERVAEAENISYGSIEALASQLYTRLHCTRLIIHLLDCSYYVSDGQVQHRKNFHTSHPVISTGGGDNFNAGFALGLLYGLDCADCVDLAHFVSGFYVSHGYSPSREELLHWLEQQGENPSENTPLFISIEEGLIVR